MVDVTINWTEGWGKSHTELIKPHFPTKWAKIWTVGSYILMNSMTYVTSFAETVCIKMIFDENMPILIWIFPPQKPQAHTLSKMAAIAKNEISMLFDQSYYLLTYN